MRLLVDTDVLLDVLAHRQPHYEASARVWTLAERGTATAFIAAISFNNIYYIVRKAEGNETAMTALRSLRDVFDWVAPDRGIINQAIDSECEDFEDAVQFHSAVSVEADYLVTRDAAGFPDSGPAIVTPAELMAILEAESQAVPPPGAG